MVRFVLQAAEDTSDERSRARRRSLLWTDSYSVAVQWATNWCSRVAKWSGSERMDEVAVAHLSSSWTSGSHPNRSRSPASASLPNDAWSSAQARSATHATRVAERETSSDSAKPFARSAAITRPTA
jgi:hypothetical protein